MSSSDKNSMKEAESVSYINMEHFVVCRFQYLGQDLKYIQIADQTGRRRTIGRNLVKESSLSVDGKKVLVLIGRDYISNRVARGEFHPSCVLSRDEESYKSSLELACRREEQAGRGNRLLT